MLRVMLHSSCYPVLCFSCVFELLTVVHHCSLEIHYFACSRVSLAFCMYTVGCSALKRKQYVVQSHTVVEMHNVILDVKNLFKMLSDLKSFLNVQFLKLG